jgi:hypothetical protein
VARTDLLSDSLFESLQSSIEPGECIYTIARPQPNWIVEITPEGAWVETNRSRRRATGPQLVPAWMLNLAFAELVKHRTLTPARLLGELNIKRSAAVCALLARLPDVELVQHPNPHLRYAGRS